MPWRIWFEVFHNDKKIGAGVWHQRYAYKSNAIRRARAMFDTPRISANTGKITTYNWTVSQTNPWVRS